MAKTSVGIAGSASVEGATRTAGVGVGIMAETDAAVKRATVLWVVAVGILVIFHVGGAHVG